MECLDLKVVGFEPNFYLREPRQCGWAWPKIGGEIKLEIYIKYKIPKDTYHDRMHIKVKAEKVYPNHFNIGKSDVCVVEDSNPSDKPVVKEITYKTTLSYYDIGGCFKGEDYRKSGWRKWKFEFFSDSGGPTKRIDLSANWDAESCKFTDYDVKGVEQQLKVKIARCSFPDVLKENEKKNWFVVTESNAKTKHAICVWNDSNNSGDIYVNGVKVSPGTGLPMHSKLDRKMFTFTGSILIPREGDYNVVITGGYYDGEYHWTDRIAVHISVVKGLQPPLPWKFIYVLPIAVGGMLAGILVARKEGRR